MDQKKKREEIQRVLKQLLFYYLKRKKEINHLCNWFHNKVVNIHNDNFHSILLNIVLHLNMDLVNNLNLFFYFNFFFLNCFFFFSRNQWNSTTITFCNVIIIIVYTWIIKNWTIPIIRCKISIKLDAIFYDEKLLRNN